MDPDIRFYFPFSSMYSAPTQKTQMDYMQSFYPPALDFSQISNCIKEEKEKYHRTWNKIQTQEVFSITIRYCQNFNKTIEELTLNDFGIISIGLEQSPEQVMMKVKEINANGTLRPGKWSQIEDEMLTNLISHHGNKWGQIASQLNSEIHNRISIRNSKNCKERWNNYLNPDINRGAWTEDEDILLLEGYLQYGNKWCSIARTLPNRIESFVKNRIKSLLHKAKASSSGSDEKSKVIEVIKKLKEKIHNPAVQAREEVLQSSKSKN